MTFGKKVFLFSFFVSICLFLTVLTGQEDSLFSFASLRPGAKKNPFTYGAKLISQRLGKILRTDFHELTKKKQILCGKEDRT